MNKGNLVSTKSRLNYIDSIRGISCIMVYLCHMLDNILGGHPNFLGKVGVCFLFALSGYCNMEVYHEYKWTWKKLLYFYVKKICAIYPCLLIALGLAYYSEFCTWGDMVDILTMHRGKGHFWSMSVIIAFYLIFPLLSVLIQKIKGIPSIVILWIGLVAWMAKFEWMEFNKGDGFIWIFVPECIAGILVYLHKELYIKRGWEKPDYRDVISIVPVVTFAFGGFVIYSLGMWMPIDAEVIKYVVGTLVCSICLYYVVTRNHVKTCLDGKWFGWLHYLGRISYQFYLVHYVILIWLNKYTLENSFERAIFSEIVVSIGLSIIISELMYTLVQQPLNRLVRMCASKLQTATEV